jgi:hypothetical protein
MATTWKWYQATYERTTQRGTKNRWTIEIEADSQNAARVEAKKKLALNGWKGSTLVKVQTLHFRKIEVNGYRVGEPTTRKTVTELPAAKAAAEMMEARGMVVDVTGVVGAPMDVGIGFGLQSVVTVYRSEACREFYTANRVHKGVWTPRVDIPKAPSRYGTPRLATT